MSTRPNNEMTFDPTHLHTRTSCETIPTSGRNPGATEHGTRHGVATPPTVETRTNCYTSTRSKTLTKRWHGPRKWSTLVNQNTMRQQSTIRRAEKAEMTDHSQIETNNQSRQLAQATTRFYSKNQPWRLPTKNKRKPQAKTRSRQPTPAAINASISTCKKPPTHSLTTNSMSQNLTRSTC